VETHVALVTGGGRGIGAAIAARLAKAGAAVIVAARSQEGCTEVADAIADEGGLAWPLYLDVADPQRVAEAVVEARELAREIGPLDWLVNGAGIARTAKLLDDGAPSGVDLYQEHLEVNFHGARRVTQALLPDMLERGYGRVVQVGSSAGLRGYRYAAAYCASKHALVGWARAAALELAGTGVAASIVCPHYVDSPMTEAAVRNIVAKTRKSAAEVRAWLAAQNPGGELVTTAEVAEAVLDLLQGDHNGALVELAGAGVRIDHEVPEA
jgi:NAD(P)-dependent dehydrogenase (short-subunit alcohol dehydrogenase family)